MSKIYYVYMLTNRTNKVLYTGVTADLSRRIYEHKEKLVDGFTKKYNVNKLVYYEEFDDISYAIEREKQIKGWKREKKDCLVNENNAEWEDLYDECF